MIFCQRENSVIFSDFRISQGSAATYCRWKSLPCIDRKIYYESAGESILKIGSHLPKLLSNIKWLTFWRHSVVTSVISSAVSVILRRKFQKSPLYLS